MIVPERLHNAHNAGLARVARGGESKVVGKTVEVAARLAQLYLRASTAEQDASRIRCGNQAESAMFERTGDADLLRTDQLLRRGNPNWIFTDSAIASSPVTKSSTRHKAARRGRETSVVQQQKPIAQALTRPHKRSAEIALI
ncbi:hypothetical protein [Mesorhizobium sp. M0983]|uniref:hypothetical protein n=1 Tax=unclassified Mesorhizobium TaxID=325217 RepID=UPI003338C7FA